MSSPTSGQPGHIIALQEELGYHFSTLRYLVEALRAPGAGSSSHDDIHVVDGYRRLAQLGESAMRLAVADDGYNNGSERSRPLTSFLKQ